MIEFATDKKISNLQLRPNGNKAITINNIPLLTKTDNNEWEIPQTMFPIDYHEINLSIPVSPRFTPGLQMAIVNNNTYGEIANDSHILYLKEGGSYYYSLNLYGLYKINTGQITLTYNTTTENNESNTDSFVNNENGYEIVESKNNNDNIYIIHPTNSLEKRVIVLKQQESDIAVLLINSCFIKPYDEYRMKITGKIADDALISVMQSGQQKLYLNIDRKTRYIYYASIESSDVIIANKPYKVQIIIQTDGYDLNIAQPFYVRPPQS